MKRYPLITADSHFDVPPSLAEKLPPEHRKKVVYLEKAEDGTTYLKWPHLGGSMSMASDAASAQILAMRAKGVPVDPDNEIQIATIVGGICCEGSRPGFSVQRRLEEMERDGIVGEVMIDNSSFIVSFTEPEVEVMWARIVNDWLVSTFTGYFDRFAPAMRLPLLRPADAAAEMERGAALGLRVAMLPNNIPGENYADPKWETVWETAERKNMRLVFHIAQLPNYGMAQMHLTGVSLTVMQYMFSSTMETLGALINSGVFERHPKLQIAMIESDAGYLEWFMQSADYYQNHRYTQFQKKIGMKVLDLAPPSYYIKRNVKAAFINDPVAVRRRHEIGMNVLMWGNDYPHPEGVFPNSRVALEQLFDGVPEKEVMQIVHDNAAEMFGLTV
jgi:predicted TIM-barrel fold metal-dependent hydrolase